MSDNALPVTPARLRLGRMLEQLIDDRNMSIRALSRECGVSASHLSNVINGKRGLNPDQAQAVADALELRYLVRFADPELVRVFERFEQISDSDRRFLLRLAQMAPALSRHFQDLLVHTAEHLVER